VIFVDVDLVSSALLISATRVISTFVRYLGEVAVGLSYC